MNASRFLSASLPALADLVDLPPELLVTSPAEEGPHAWLEGVVAWINGRRNHTTSAREQLGRGRLERAVHLARRAEARSDPDHAEVVSEIRLAWERRRSEFEAEFSGFRRRLDAVDASTPDARSEAQRVVATLPQRSSEPSDGLPSEDALRELGKSRALFLEIEEEVAFVEALARDEREALAARFYEHAEKAFRRLLGLHRDGTLSADDNARRALFALPQLVMERRVPAIAGIADPTVALSDINLPAVDSPVPWPRSAVVPTPRLGRLPAVGSGPQSLGVGPLSSISQALLAIVSKTQSPRGRNLTDADWRVLRAEAEMESDPGRRGSLWLGASGSFAEPWALRCVGEGLYWNGVSEDRRGAPERARPLLEDATCCLCQAGDQEVLPRTLKTLVEVGTPASYETLDEALRAPGRLELLARTWERRFEGKAVSPRVLRAVSAAYGDDVHVLLVFAKALLTPHNLLTRPRAVADGILDLISDASYGDSLTEALDEMVTTLLPPERADRRTWVPRGGAVRRVAERLDVELVKLGTGRGIAPVTEVRDRLSSILAQVEKSRKTAAEKPQLSLVAQIHAVWPEDRRRDLRLPVVVRNGEDGAPAANLALQLRVEADDAPPLDIEFDPPRAEVGPLESGEEREVVFFFNLPEGVETRRAGFRVAADLLQGGAMVKDSGAKRSFGVEIRPSTRRGRREPFVTGTAVEGEQFVGRSREMDLLVSKLAGDVGKKPVVVHGIRRIGKTSVVKRLCKVPEMARRYYADVWSVEDRPESDTTALFLGDLADQLLLLLPPGDRGRHRKARAKIDERPYAGFEAFVRELDESPADKAS